MILHPLVFPGWNKWSFNGRESAINRALDGSTYPGWKLVPSSLCQKKFAVKKRNNLYLVLGAESSVIEPYCIKKKRKKSCCGAIFRPFSLSFWHTNGSNKLVIYFTRLESLTRTQHSSLLEPVVSYEENQVLWIWPLFKFFPYKMVGAGDFCPSKQGSLTEGEGSVQLTSCTNQFRSGPFYIVNII